MKKNDISLGISLIISTVFNPFLVLFLTILISNKELIQKQPQQALIFFIVNATLPLIFYFYYLFNNKKRMFALANVPREGRNTIFLTAIFSTLISTILFTFTEQNTVWVYTSMLLTVFFAIYFMVNKYIDKLSLHAGVFAFSMVYLVDKSSVAFVIFLAALPIIYWARIKLNQHSWLQLLIGTSVGMFVGILAWTF